jgi:UDP-N-acetyl-D-galactosamine dehydrogenase
MKLLTSKVLSWCFFAHNELRALGYEGISDFCKSKCILYDLKYVLLVEESDLRL